MQLEVWFA